MDTANKRIPKTLNPKELTGWEKTQNNQSNHMLITPTFWCASNLLSLMFMLLLAMSFFIYHEVDKINEVKVRYDEVCKPVR